MYQLYVQRGGTECAAEQNFIASDGHVMSDREAAVAIIMRPMSYGSQVLAVFIMWNGLFFYKDGVWSEGKLIDHVKADLLILMNLAEIVPSSFLFIGGDPKRHTCDSPGYRMATRWALEQCRSRGILCTNRI